MQTLHDILNRENERFDLKNMGFCTLVVLVLVGIAFGLMNINTLFPSGLEKAQQEKANVEKIAESQ